MTRHDTRLTDHTDPAILARLPDLLIGGMPKAGTTTLFRWLTDHPQVQGAAEKEPAFFADPGSHVFRKDFNARDHGPERYAAAFPPRAPGTRAVIEATPTTLYSCTALASVPRLPSRPRLLFILRDPAAQVRSVWHYYRTAWDHIPPGLSFPDFVAVLEQGEGRFAGNELCEDALRLADPLPYLLAWRDALGEERMQVIRTEDLGDPVVTMTGLSQWIGIDAAFWKDYRFPRENASYTPVSPALHKAMRRLRDALPSWAVPAEARALYRRLATRRPEAARECEREVMARLRDRYASSVTQLEAEFALDLSAWADPSRMAP